MHEELFSSKASITVPYELILYNRKRIVEAAHEHASGHTQDHVKLLLDDFQKEHKITSEKLDEIDTGDCKRISFQDVWLLYPPGTTVFQRDEGEWRAYKVERVEYQNQHDSNTLLVRGYYLDFDKTGNYLVPQLENLTVRSYSLEKSVASLEVLPGWYFQRYHDLYERLLERGKAYSSYSAKVCYRQYQGDAWPKTTHTVSSIRMTCILIRIQICMAYYRIRSQ